MLSPESTVIVRATAAVVAEHAVEITSKFYPAMFEAHPELLRIFNKGNQANGDQRKALAASVVAYAVQLIDPEAPSFHPVMERIAHKHVSLGIRPEQYTIVGRYLMGAIGEVLGDAVTPEIAQAWDEVYWLFASQLIAEESRLYTVAGVDPTVPWRRYTVAERVQEATDIITLVLKPSDGGKVPAHQPGQYISVAVDLPDGSRQPRQFTVSTGSRAESVQITIRRARGSNGAPDGVVSSFLHDAVRVGDELDVSATPAGDVVLEEGQDPLLLISAGVGITPIAAILDDLSTTTPNRVVTVAHADRSAAHHPMWQAVCAAGDSMSHLTTHTWYEELGGAAEERSATQGFMDLTSVTVPDNAQVFMCGPLPFMQAARTALIRRGVPASQIKYEVFGPDLWAGSPAA